jgi:hypothetical protein
VAGGGWGWPAAGLSAARDPGGRLNFFKNKSWGRTMFFYFFRFLLIALTSWFMSTSAKRFLFLPPQH